MEFLTDVLHRHGALILFGAVFAEQAGLPLPAWPLLVAAGVLIGMEHMGLIPAAGAALLATLVADGLWYLAGQRRGRSVLALLCRIALEPDTCVRRTEEFFRMHGPHALLLAKFIPGFSTAAPPLAGVVGIGPLNFLLYDALGTALWVGSGLGLGYAFGAGTPLVAALGTHMAPLVGATVAALLGVYLGAKAWRRRAELKQAPRITVTEVLERLNTGEAVLFVDLRSAVHRHEVPGIAGAVTMSLADLAGQAAALPKDGTIVFYCACPRDASSAEATLLLRRLGFEQAWALAGGIEAWRAMVKQPTVGLSVSDEQAVAA
ncbi:MAG TPA: VTT domain-containing protein [Nitrospiraceae bacterium]|nr:VTT domain-containing protein [Nitrospiraceae bacterium]